ncbi:cytochrome P450 [Mycobacterium sp. Root265]|uniref:cytochrome P450 n=1 Tax=Mycobacterium sp. Root265 TaxID=1736504 RepID=UPI00138EDAA7|nr:cytochrome P450 [Mycobacterium sp. Root265]
MADMTPAMRAAILYEANPTFSVDDPRPVWDELLRDYPVIKWEMGVGFFRADDITAAGRHPGVISVNPYTGLSMGMGSRDQLIPLHLTGDTHLRYRKLLTPLLTAKRMEPWGDAVRELTDELIDGFIGDGHAELYEQVCQPLPTKIFLRLFGLPQDDREALIQFKDDILSATGDTLDGREQAGIAAGDRLREHLSKRLAERKNEPHGEDLISQFLTFELDGHKLTDDEIVNLMHMFTIAGLDTVTSSLSVQFAFLATHPEERQRLVANPSLWPTAVEELMRTESPVPQGGLRWAAEDIEINGVEVKKGHMIFLGWASANIDPSVFEDPMGVDLTRKPNRHMSFAVGLHRCLGSHLARLEMVAALNRFHERIPSYTVTEGDPIRYQAIPGIRSATRIPVSF